MSLAGSLGIACALAAHAGFLLFGGVLFGGGVSQGGATQEVELLSEQALVRHTARIRQRPALRTGKGDAPHPPVRLRVEQRLADLTVREAEAGRDLGGRAHAAQSQRVHGQQGEGGVRDHASSVRDHTPGGA